MPKPQPESVDESKVRDLALQLVSEVKFPVLATSDPDGHPRVRPVSPVLTEGFTVYVANLRVYSKTAEIAANPRVELCYMDREHDQVRISGVAEVLSDAGKIQSIWDLNPLLKHYLGTPDNPELIIYRIAPVRVRYMKEWALHYHEVPVDPPRSS